MASTTGTVISRGAPSSPAVIAPAAVVIAGLLAFLLDADLVAEVSRGDFALVTLFLGGGASWLSGRAIARTWRPYRQVVVYALLLACVVRFFHFALFNGTLLSLHYFITDAAFLLAISTLGFRAERASQMATRYSWLYSQAGPFGWRGDAGHKTSGDAV